MWENPSRLQDAAVYAGLLTGFGALGGSTALFRQHLEYYPQVTQAVGENLAHFFLWHAGDMAAPVVYLAAVGLTTLGLESVANRVFDLQGKFRQGPLLLSLGISLAVSLSLAVGERENIRLNSGDWGDVLSFSVLPIALVVHTLYLAVRNSRANA